jgi:hypothetical protein
VPDLARHDLERRLFAALRSEEPDELEAALEEAHTRLQELAAAHAAAEARLEDQVERNPDAGLTDIAETLRVAAIASRERAELTPLVAQLEVRAQRLRTDA